jgi:peptidoglycan L-alanyl-D-glutamate endopeptidase CwlK
MIIDPIFHNDVQFFQRFLRIDALYQGPISGIWDDATEAAAQRFTSGCANILADEGPFDTRSEQRICALSLRAQVEARRCLRRIRQAGFDARIISGTRTYAEQDALFRQGRFGDPRKIVTNAQAGHSNHNFGIAWDIGLFQGHTYIDDEQPYRDAAVVGKSPALEWGGEWKSISDAPRYQLKLGLEVAQVRQLFEAGQVAVAFA